MAQGFCIYLKRNHIEFRLMAGGVVVETEQKPVKNWVLPLGAMACALLWGSAFPAIKLAYTFFDGMDFANRLAFAGIRFTLAGFALLCLQKNLIQKIRSVPKWLLLAVSLAQVTIQYALFYWGLSLVPGVLAAILNATGSFWWIILAPLVDRGEDLTWRKLGWVGIGFIGVVICVYRPGGLSSGAPLGIVLLLISTICATCASLLVRPLARFVPTRFISGGSLFIGGSLLLLAAPQALPRLFSDHPTEVALIIAYLAFVSAVAFSLWYRLITLFDVATLSGYRYLIPVFGVLESALFIAGEHLIPSFAIGFLLVLCAIRLIERDRKRFATRLNGAT